jgi:hypothetical protein
MPPSGFSTHAVKGALQFVKGCYQDLLQEVQDGKHESYEKAIEFEIGQIDSALSQLHINRKGKVTKRRKK